ncbi:hypothetical protein PC123_g25706 [Phytophthora cactorum]|nr:hypothetical protein PC123_g25706 [Phytophthora cactorum]
MARVTGSSGDSRFHLEAQEEDEVPIKLEPRKDASAGRDVQPGRAPVVPGHEHSDGVLAVVSLKEPVAQAPVTTNKLDTAKATLRLLKEAGVPAGAFKLKNLFDLVLEVMQIALLELFEKLGVLVGMSLTQIESSVNIVALLPPPPGSGSQTGLSRHSRYVFMTSKEGSDS